jgi:hypothetical protein
MAGENMTLSWGTNNAYAVKCSRILFGPNIVSTQDSGQGGAAHYKGFGAKAIYVRQYFMSTVGISVIQSTWEEREAFVNWCLSYAKYISTSGVNPPMRMRGPRGFDFYGFLTEGFDRTNAVSDLAYTMNLTFRGCQPTFKGIMGFAAGSVASAPQSIGGANSQFYPFENLQAGPAVAAEAKLYDKPTDDTGGLPITLSPSVNTTSPTPSSVLQTSIPGSPGKGAA